MAEPLKNRYGPEVPQRIGAMLAAVTPGFDAALFCRDVLADYEARDLMARGQRIAQVMRDHLPASYPDALDRVMASIGPKLATTNSFGMGPFLYLPYVNFVARYGLDHFEPSMAAQHALTQRFTAEFSIRPYLERHPQATLARLHEWADDPSEHVRRLVSEGTRPRLPWASRLREFQRDPAPVLALLERLKDDGSLYVRRSVANNLNDIGKDHPAMLVQVTGRWWRDAPAGSAGDHRRWLVRHALRSAVKRADPDALALLGFGRQANMELLAPRITPAQLAIGGAVTIGFDLENRTAAAQRVLVDFRVHFVKANGRAAPKVFKLKTVDLAAGQRVSLSRKLSVARMSTRQHYAGRHQVDVMLNGQVMPLGAFELIG
jgi:3-methyladenine DNA glycosylase AlkC